MVEFEHHWGTEAQVVKGTKCDVYTIDERVWLSVENDAERPTIAIGEWTTIQNEATSFNSKAMNAIFNAVSMEEF